MEIKISQMFNNVSIEPDNFQIQEDTNFDKDRIKNLVFSKIDFQLEENNESLNKSRKNYKRIFLIASVIAAVTMFTIGVNAATGGKFFGALLLNNENRHIATEPNPASMEAVPLGSEYTPPKKNIIQSTIIKKSQIQTLNVNSITNVVGVNSDGYYGIPEILTNNGDLVIFTKESSNGWNLKKGDNLSIQYKLDLESNKLSDVNGESMEIGYIKNGTLIPGILKKEKSFTYSITADEAGEYYFYVQNYSAGYIVIEEGFIK